MQTRWVFDQTVTYHIRLQQKDTVNTVIKLAMIDPLNKLLKICSKIMLQSSTDCHNSSEQLTSNLFLTSQCSHVGEDSTLGSRIPLLGCISLLGFYYYVVYSTWCAAKVQTSSWFSSSYFTVVRPIQFTIGVNSQVAN